ncbi:MAG TPA: hypothetical protein VM165_12640 [Planctomycetaceae bacterium]|nr:hypothetical protein [Planctomycetaceae bacterium]
MDTGIKTNIPEVQAALLAAGREMEAEQREVLNTIGLQLLSFVQLDYSTKSTGGTGTDGISWKPLAASTIARKQKRGKRNDRRKKQTTKSGKARPGIGSTVIGIDTGLQRNSASPGFKAPGGGNVLHVEGHTVTVGFGRSYSKYFDEQRKLMPTTLPAEWERACDAILTRWATKILAARID